MKDTCTTISLVNVDEEQMQALGRALAKALHARDIVSLEGSLGAGKTYLVREVAKALGYPHHVTSPTFVLQKLYALPEPRHGIDLIIHYDIYRLDSYDELREIGFEELPDGAVAFVEWGRKFIQHFPPSVVRIGIHGRGNEKRRVAIGASGDRIPKFIGALNDERLAPELSTSNIIWELFDE
ncbi:MAG: tRNA (adenosine(37)-N6)-threonylcarbamoyltransferase complex ATPase subunit type 1 TsaE [Candidatus Sumerlaeaceae bacterium]|nr:tRNA (adenosine(37)-N6)-threonylcarbamoyltransferase complex ATPase subunit type 1 TsaE [Candidatus Sumerlaeaceae bacterium]